MVKKAFVQNISQYYCPWKEVVQYQYFNRFNMITTRVSTFSAVYYTNFPYTNANIKTHIEFVIAVGLYNADIPALASMCLVI